MIIQLPETSVLLYTPCRMQDMKPMRWEAVCVILCF